MAERIKGIARLVAVAVATANLFLTAKGINPIPFSEEEVYAGVSALLEALALLWAWWKNNNMTNAAQQAQAVLEEFKEAGSDVGIEELTDEEAELMKNMVWEDEEENSTDGGSRNAD